MTNESESLQKLASRALELAPAGGIVGLGTGRAATAFIRALGQQVRAGLKVKGVSTSQASTDLATELGIPLTTLDEVSAIDVTFDGADEVAPQGNLIKGYGGALVREKIVATSSRKLVILVGPEKIVPKLGTRGKLPVEVVPFGLAVCRRRLLELGLTSEPRLRGDKLWTTDNGNYILDCNIRPLDEPAKLERAILAITGVVDTGFFLNLAPVVLVAEA